MNVSSSFRNVWIVVSAAICLSIQFGCQPETSEPGPATVAKAAPEPPVANKPVTLATDANAKTETSNPPRSEKAVTPPTESISNPVFSNPEFSNPPPPPPEFVNPHFEAPFRLMVKNEPLNVAAKQMYPSPGMYDVDNDGQTELIVGDIFGSLNVYENQNEGDSDPVWSKHYALKTASGKPIKVSNW